MNNNLNMELINKYYNNDITQVQLKEKYSIHHKQLYKMCEELGLPKKSKLYEMFNCNKELATYLLSKYSNMKVRVNNKHGGRTHYGQDILDRLEYIKFCNKNMTKIKNLYKNYKNNKILKNTISIDRIIDENGYTKDNIQFVTQGFNSWKASLKRQIKVYEKLNDEYKYFMSLQEASRYYNKPEKYFSHLFHDYNKENEYFVVSRSNLNKVLINNNCDDLLEYYNKRGD